MTLSHLVIQEYEDYCTVVKGFKYCVGFMHFYFTFAEFYSIDSIPEIGGIKASSVIKLLRRYRYET